MKKTKTIIAFAFVMCSLVSCSSSDEIEETTNNSSAQNAIKVAYLDVNGGITNSGDVQNQVLCFDSETQYNEFVQKVEELSKEDKAKIFSDLGFTNLVKIANIADVELDSLSDNSQNEADFRNQYKKYVNKYSEALITNKYDSLDLTLYVPASNNENVDPYIVGAKKAVIINGVTRKIDFTDDMNSSDKLLFGNKTGVREVPITRGYEPSELANYPLHKGVNSVNNWMEYSTKLVVQTEIKKDGIFQVHIGVQKATWYGSKRASRPIFFAWEHIEGFNVNPGISSNNGYLVSTCRMVDGYVSPYYGVTNDKYSKKNIYCAVGNEEFPFGKIQNMNNYYISGILYVWVMDRGESYDMSDYWSFNFKDYPCAKVFLDYCRR